MQQNAEYAALTNPALVLGRVHDRAIGAACGIYCGRVQVVQIPHESGIAHFARAQAVEIQGGRLCLCVTYPCLRPSRQSGQQQNQRNNFFHDGGFQLEQTAVCQRMLVRRTRARHV